MFGSLAQDVINHKYAATKGDGTKETWDEIADRVANSVLATVNASRDLKEEVAYRIKMRQIIPGGRYLYAAGREFHQIQNCLLMRAEDSREGWANLMQKSGMALMTGAGIGINYSQVRPEGSLIRRTGGTATGPLALMQMINEQGRGIMQGGSRRSAIWAGLNWNHPDIFKFIKLKNWIPEVRALKERDFNFPATMDGTNVSICLDDEFFNAYSNSSHNLHSLAHEVYSTALRQMLKTGEPGFSIDCGNNTGEDLRNAPVCAETRVLTSQGYKAVADIVNNPTTIWTGTQWAKNVVFKKTGSLVPTVKVTMTGYRSIQCDPTHEFLVNRFIGAGKARKLIAIDRVKARNLQVGDSLFTSPPKFEEDKFSVEAYTFGYIYGDGNFTTKSGNADITFCTNESKACAQIIKQSNNLSSINWNDSRNYIRAYFKVNNLYANRYKSVFPEEVFNWSLGDIYSFIAGIFDADGNYDESQHRIRLASKHFEFLRNVARLLEQVGIIANITKAGISKTQGYLLVVAASFNNTFTRLIPTVRIQPKMYKPYRQSQIKVLSVTDENNADVFCADVKVPEHSFMAEGVIISNCTEVSSYDDSDICNLGSINLARINSLDDMKACVDIATALLVAGTVYSDVPYEKVRQVREKNRRLGLGLMGVHEWFIIHGKKYGPDNDLEKLMNIYATSTEVAHQYCNKWNLSPCVKTRAIAPTGTIGIVAETTTGIEPMLCAAYKRRYLKGTTWHFQYVVESVAKRLVDEGIDPSTMEDAYALAENPQRRVAFQAWMQKYVDHCISSTINLPSWGSQYNNDDTVKSFGDMLIQYLPQLRGITCYPDGARGGQPITAVTYDTAMEFANEIFIEASDICDITKGGTCGS